MLRRILERKDGLLWLKIKTSGELQVSQEGLSSTELIGGSPDEPVSK
jgi:hypothetical protein